MNGNFLVVLSCGLDNPNRSTRGLQLATIAQRQGRNVTVFLLDDAVFIAKKGLADNMRTVTGDEAADMLFHLQEFEVPIFACTACAKIRHIDETNIIEGARMAPPDELIKLSNNSTVISL